MKGTQIVALTPQDKDTVLSLVHAAVAESSKEAQKALVDATSKIYETIAKTNEAVNALALETTKALTALAAETSHTLAQCKSASWEKTRTLETKITDNKAGAVEIIRQEISTHSDKCLHMLKAKWFAIGGIFVGILLGWGGSAAVKEAFNLIK